MFYIMSIFFYAKGRLSQQIKKRSWPWFCSCAISAILSFGCKEISATLPVFILLYEWFFLQNLDTNWLKRNFSLVIAASFLILVLSFFLSFFLLLIVRNCPDNGRRTSAMGLYYY
jgi:hypothetical protein